ncbi:MAG: hypothetical protein ACI4QO_08415, partial [Clostridia bacterium]
EALQYPWESYSKTFYGNDVPLYANGKDENGNYIDAVINPSAMKENALVGGTVGALMGGFGGYTSKVNHDNAVAGVDSRELAALKAAADDYRKGMIDGAQLRAASSAVKRQASAERIYIEKAYSNDTQAEIRANEAVRRGILTREEADIALKKGISLPNIDNNGAMGYNEENRERGQLSNDNGIAGRLEGNDLGRTTGMDQHESGNSGSSGELAADDSRGKNGLDRNQYREDLRSPRSGMSDLRSQGRNPGTRNSPELSGNLVTLEEVPQNNTSRFSVALDRAKGESVNGGMVDSQSPEELAGARVFLSPDDMCGVAVKDGNIIGVFNNEQNPVRGVVPELIRTAIANGGTRLDCYVKYGSNGEYSRRNLLTLYSKSGMVPVAWMEFDAENFDIPGGNPYAPPDVVFMSAGKGDVPQIWTKDMVHSLPKFSDYEAAQQYAAEIGQRNSSSSINIRNTDLNGTEERGHAQTAYDDAFNRGEVGMVDAIDSAFLNGDPGVTKNTLTDAEAQATVNDSLAGKDYQQAANDFIRKSNAATKQGLKELVTEGITIYIEAVNTGDINTAIDIMNANSVLATEISRGLQAYTQLRKMTPEGRLYHANAMMIREAKATTGFDGVEIKRRVDSEVNASMENIVSDFISGESVEEPASATGKQQKVIERAEKKAAKDKEAMKAEDETGADDLFDEDLEETGNTIADNVKRRQRKKAEGKKKPREKDGKKGELNLVAEAKRVIAKGIKDGEISVKDLVMNGDIDDSVIKIVEYVDGKENLSPEETVELIAAVSEELQWRANKYRERALDKVKKEMFYSGKEAKIEKRGRAIVDKLIEYNRIGALSDSYTGDMIYTYIGVPMMSEVLCRFRKNTYPKWDGII